MVTVYELPYFSKIGFIAGLVLGIAVFSILNLRTDLFVAGFGGCVTLIVTYYLVKYMDKSDIPTLTYLSEKDVEKIRKNLLKAQEENNG